FLRGRLPGGLRFAPGLERDCALDDLLEHRTRFAALRRTMGLPDVRVLLGEDIFEITLTLHAERRELGDVQLAGPLVAVLDQQPAAAAAAAPAPAGADEHPGPLQLVAVERELEIPLLQRGIDIV